MDLNPEQQAAVDCGEGIFQVLAGPGAGKTKVLSSRHSRLVDLEYKAVSITFTRDAAKEMEQRTGDPNCLTIHKLAYNIDNPHQLYAYKTPIGKVVAEATKHLYRPIFDFVQVDESQDCSAEDWEFIRRLSPNILAVGDAMQCVFGFRSSKPELFLDMPNMFPNCQTMLLGKNYRSTKNILNFCRSIAPIRGELLSRMCTDNEEGEPVEFLSFDNNVAEADGVLNLARKLNGSTAILARTNRQLEVFRKLELASCIYDLMTVHKAKGGEWDNCFLVGAQEGLLPYKNGDLDEEARILFVAASRAKKRLFISSYGSPSTLLKGVV